MADAVAVVLFVGVTAYAVFGGADFGAGAGSVKRIHAHITAPATVNRNPAIRKGGISRTPMRMARYVDPQTR